VLCSGKVYYELLEARRTRAITNVAIARIEQLYPFPKDALAALLPHYPGLRAVVWCQEEPRNQGAWDQIKHRIVRAFGERVPLHYAGRAAAAAPSTGYRQQHVHEQNALIEEALAGDLDSKTRTRIPA
jgi:2-oxoglutarate dehydrogenase E1 component